ncbi:regulator of nonsense transcripts 1 [Nematocida major]|uniref:regulator of nonsense transcripts 1 n=1 Tax=Nematocida major TaxID=1912982 RepID=UPI00200881C1|nr:regulator of nonsense transcripts 1 [Nematocida major]KAH9386629.1 regulator of nonsense transcripts 1 [Nematocida major]
MPDQCEEIQKVNHSQETLAKIQKHRMADDLSQLEGMNVPAEIESIRKGLINGSIDSFLEMAEYMWVELPRSDSVLLPALREFIPKNRSIRLVPPTPLIPVIFLFPGESVLKEWAIVNICELYSSPRYLAGMVTGGRFFYKMHTEILEKKCAYSEKDFLKGLFIFSVLGGSLVNSHYALLRSLIQDPLRSDMLIEFNIYKILLAEEVDIHGNVKIPLRNTRGMLEEVLEKMLRMQLEQFLGRSKQVSSNVGMLLLFTTWEALEVSIRLNISKALKLQVMQAGLAASNKYIVRRLYQSIMQVYRAEGLSMIELFRSGLLEYLIAQTGYIPTEAAHSDYTLLIQDVLYETCIHTFLYMLKVFGLDVPPLCSVKMVQAHKSTDIQEMERALARACEVWISRMHIYPDSILGKSAECMFFGFRNTLSLPIVGATNATDFLMPRVRTFYTVLEERLSKMDRSGLTARERVIIASLYGKKHAERRESVDPRILFQIIEECVQFYKYAKVVPYGLNEFCGVVEKYINGYVLKQDTAMKNATREAGEDACLDSSEYMGEDWDIIQLLYKLVGLPITDAVLSQVNHIIVHLDKMSEDAQKAVDFSWARKICLKLAQRKNLKMTFLKNLFDKYLSISMGSKTEVSSMMNVIHHLHAENNLREDEAMNRLFKRAEKITQKKEPSLEASTVKEILAPMTQDIIAWAAPKTTCKETRIGESDFVQSILINEAYENASGICFKYKTPQDYFNAYYPLLVKETYASIIAASENMEGSETDSVPVGFAGPKMKFKVVRILEKSHTMCMEMKSLGKISSGIYVNSVVKIYREENTLQPPLLGIVVSHSFLSLNITDAVSVCIGATEAQNKYHTVFLQPFTNITTGMREFNALSAMCLQFCEMQNIVAVQCQKADENVHPPEVASASAQGSEWMENDLNSSQREAINAALTRRITLIQGPPGTGKTKTISHLIVRLLNKGQRILVCAPSNAAIGMLESSMNWNEFTLSWLKVNGRTKRAEAPCQDPAGADKLESFSALGKDAYEIDVKPDEGINGLDSREKASIRAARLVFCTLSMAGSSTMKGNTFDTVIIDEACQSTELSTIIPLSTRPQSLVLVGDPMQLPPTVISRSKPLAVSLFERMAHSVKPFLLNTQYRMHSDISRFVSETFYEGRLLDGVTRSSHLPLAFVNIPGIEKVVNKSITNRMECDAVVRISEAAMDVYKNVGIISPYKGQVELLEKRLYFGHVSTVDGFQGQEKECIIISTVRTAKIGFLNDYRRLNVALSRAKLSVIVVGCAELLRKDPMWRSFIEYAERNNCVYKQKAVCSILLKASTSK